MHNGKCKGGERSRNVPIDNVGGTEYENTEEGQHAFVPHGQLERTRSGGTSVGVVPPRSWLGLGARHYRPRQNQGPAAAQPERGGGAAVLWRQPVGMGAARLPPVAALPLSQ
eukprot:scaffold31671_cov57-Phaeocystis_antarctica.AAC.1